MKLEAARVELVKAGSPTTAVDRKIASEREDLKTMNGLGNLPGTAEASPKVEADRHEAATGEAVKPTKAEAESWAERTFAHAKENPQLFLYKMKSAGYKYSWALIPISLPFIWMMFFWKRRFGMYDHAVFATYSLAFMSLLVVALSVLISYGTGIVMAIGWTALFVLPPIHMYKQLKYGYLLGRFGAAWRTFVLLNIVLTSAILFFMLLLYLGAD